MRLCYASDAVEILASLRPGDSRGASAITILQRMLGGEIPDSLGFETELPYTPGKGVVLGPEGKGPSGFSPR